MKKGIFFFLFGFIPFFFPFLSFGAYPGECKFVKTVLTPLSPVSYYLSPVSYYSYYSVRTVTLVVSSGTLSSVVSGDLLLGSDLDYIYRIIAKLYYYDNGSWFFQDTIAGTNTASIAYELDGVPHGPDLPDQCPDPCADAGIPDPVEQCGEGAYTMHNAETCDYTCDDCLDDYNAAVAACGEGNFTISLDNVLGEGCDWLCTDCDAKETEAESECTSGWMWTDLDSCAYDCVSDCTKSFNWCQAQCYQHNGIYRHNCVDDATGILSQECICNDDESLGDEDPEDPTDPEDPIDPEDKDPEDDPEEDPDDTETVVSNKWLEAIKGNTDSLIEQGNDDAEEQAKQTALLTNIDSNIKINTANQKDLNSSLKGIGNKIDNSNSILSDIKGELSDGLELKDSTMEGSGSELPASHVYDIVVEQPEEDSLVDTVNDFITDGLPLMSFINGSYLNVGSSSSVMSFEIYGHTMQTDLSNFEGLLDTMGVLLLGVATLCSFLIIVGRI